MTTSEDTPAQLSPAPFPDAPRRQRGYDRRAVDEFLARARASFEKTGSEGELIDAAAVRQVAFPLVRGGYSIAAVDGALGRVEDAFAAVEREREVTTAGAETWVERARDHAQEILEHLARPRGRRFARTSWLTFGYRIDEVDLISDKLARYFESGDPVTVDQVRAVAFRMQRAGYREEQVDALLDAVVDVMLAVR
ncbi:DivIVA domain-containing protein [Micromonospora sp. DT81.3]|uniref:DivIVA domain-containing protein n=1 Tax=Micromonospora sp. DT81.3 TaxID=3416523 RepID=UPI003CF4D4C8